MARFHADMDALDMRPPIAEPRATAAIDEIIGFIGMLLESGHAYQTHGTVYFDVATFAALRRGQPLLRGRRWCAWRASAAATPTTRNARPARLRAVAAVGRPTSRRGRRRSAWAVRAGTSSARRWRCTSSATTIDLHGGGTDLIFPHHECEVAQSEAVTGEPFVRHWMHSAMVRLEGEKMSKSLGNLVFVERPAARSRTRGRSASRCLRHHYRSGFEWHDELHARRRGPARRLASPPATGDAALDEVRAALDDDLDTPGAIAAIDAAAAAGHGVSEAAALLGVTL